MATFSELFVITPTCSFVLCAETRREMEEWVSSIKTSAIPPRSRGDSFYIEQNDIFANDHHWYATSHARPTYCNVCRDALSGVTSHGLSCEVCKCKVHKRCAAKAIANCKWTTLATIGKDIIEDSNGSIIMPHQWMEGNLPVSAVCVVCKRTCGSVLRLQDWRCLWCRATVHVACRPQTSLTCPLGPAKLSVVPPTCVHSIGSDDSWDVVSPKETFSPLLVFVNSKSGDNQGVKFLRRFKQLLNPAQVFDLISTGPSLGLRLFRHFELFRILVCSGDGSVGWVLSEIDRFNMHKQCQVAVLPLGTGNDLARVLGWGSSCDDDAHLPQILERYESASTKMLDRWSIMVFEKAISIPGKEPKMSLSSEQEALLNGMVTSANESLRSIVETDDLQILIHSTKTLCETIYALLERLCEHRKDDEHLTMKCEVLRQKLNTLLTSLKEEEINNSKSSYIATIIDALMIDSTPSSPIRSASQNSLLYSNISLDKYEKDELNLKERRIRKIMKNSERDFLQCRANSVKRALYNVVEHSEPGRPKRYQRRLSVTPFEAFKITSTTSTSSTPCASPIFSLPPINITSPTLETTQLTCISPVIGTDNRRESIDEHFLNTISLPVPTEFADSRRSSGIPESIQERAENNTAEASYPNQNKMESSFSYAINSYNLNISMPSSTECCQSALNKRNFLTVPIVTNKCYSLSELRPIEVLERDYYMSKRLNEEKKISNDNKLLYSCRNVNESLEINDNQQSPKPQICTNFLNETEANVYTSENLTIIDTDENELELENNDETAEDSSEGHSNEECSMSSELEDKSDNNNQIQQLGDLLQSLESVTFLHIDSPEASDETEAIPTESLMDDISSVLGHDIMLALQDSITTDDSTTLCSEITPTPNSKRNKKSPTHQHLAASKRRNSSPGHIKQSTNQQHDENSPQQFGFENIVFEIDNRCDDQKIREPTGRHCSLAHFVDGNDIARQSFKRHKKRISLQQISISKVTGASITEAEETADIEKSKSIDNTTKHNISPLVTIDVTSNSNTTTSNDESKHLRPINKLDVPEINSCLKTTKHYGESPHKFSHGHEVKRITFDESCKKGSFDDINPHNPQISVTVRPPTPLKSNNAGLLDNVPSPNLLSANVPMDLRRHSSHTTTSTSREYESKDKDRRYSGYNTNYLTLSSEHSRYLNSSPAATRRISCGSLFRQPNENFTSMHNLKNSRASLLGSTIFNFDHLALNYGTDNKNKDRDRDKRDKSKSPTEENKKLPIINPLVVLPNWPNLTGGSSFISKCLLANADTLCAAVSPLMDPDETLLAGYHEKCVMNNYFGIGIDAKISLDFHNKREEHPEKCRSRAKNYIWYGVLGSKQLLQKTCKNLEQRVQLECDGQRIPLPSLQGIVILNIPSFMGGTNFWGTTKRDDIFLAPSFDDRILEVVAVFGSVQMAASRLINLQHHRIAQCQSVQINILGEEEVPIQVDGEAWLQPPGMIRILHKNRVQMLCRNRNLEMSLKSWHEKQRQQSISIQRDHSSTASEHAVCTDDSISERECYILLNFIEAVSSLIKWVKFLIISHPNLRHDLYGLACHAQDALENIHPEGRLLEGPSLRIKSVEVIESARQLYDDACNLLRDRGHSLILREDLETKLSAALANMEMELRKCSVQKCDDGNLRAYFNILTPNEEQGDGRRKSRAFWTRLRSGSIIGQQPLKPPLTNTRDGVSNWSVNEVVTWLETMQLSEYVDSFLKNDIRGKELLTLGRRDLRDLGVIKIGHVKRILQAIKDMNEN